ncbi:hypothetical protein O3P69_015304 [Scylla paramamosain]|uniref:Profilin n=1 Tax=Scylla paramamosain TaxID=85552 RepID=A0AAW0T4F9_SCYPA
MKKRMRRKRKQRVGGWKREGVAGVVTERRAESARPPDSRHRHIQEIRPPTHPRGFSPTLIHQASQHLYQANHPDSGNTSKIPFHNVRRRAIKVSHVITPGIPDFRPAFNTCSGNVIHRWLSHCSHGGAPPHRTADRRHSLPLSLHDNAGHCVFLTHTALPRFLNSVSVKHACSRSQTDCSNEEARVTRQPHLHNAHHPKQHSRHRMHPRPSKSPSPASHSFSLEIEQEVATFGSSTIGCDKTTRTLIDAWYRCSEGREGPKQDARQPRYPVAVEGERPGGGRVKEAQAYTQHIYTSPSTLPPRRTKQHCNEEGGGSQGVQATAIEVSTLPYSGPPAPPSPAARPHRRKMSWDSYINNLISSGHVQKAAIYGLDGSKWAASEGFEVSKDEFDAMKAGFSDTKNLTMSGMRVAQTKFFFLSGSDEIFERQERNNWSARSQD